MKQVSEGRYKLKGRKVRIPRQYIKTRDKQIINDEKLRRNSCLLCGLQVTQQTASEFDFDHRQPNDKLYNVSILKGRAIDTTRLVQEMAKCDLLCCKCHRRKTLAQKDWQPNKQAVTQITLFDI